jgi:Bacterial regulatory proteins, tetR family
MFTSSQVKPKSRSIRQTKASKRPIPDTSGKKSGKSDTSDSTDAMQATAPVPPSDRRVQRTKRRLSESLIALMLEKGYEAVTVQDILQRADVGRSTFYLHYENKDQLLLAGPQNLGKPLFDPKSLLAGSTSAASNKAEGGTAGPIVVDLSPLFQHLAEHRTLGEALFGGKGSRLFMEHLAGQIRDAIVLGYRSRYGRSRRDRNRLHWRSLAATAAVQALIENWLTPRRKGADEGLDKLTLEDIRDESQRLLIALL